MDVIRIIIEFLVPRSSWSAPVSRDALADLLASLGPINLTQVSIDIGTAWWLIVVLLTGLGFAIGQGGAALRFGGKVGWPIPYLVSVFLALASMQITPLPLSVVMLPAVAWLVMTVPVALVAVFVAPVTMAVTLHMPGGQGGVAGLHAQGLGRAWMRLVNDYHRKRMLSWVLGRTSEFRKFSQDWQARKWQAVNRASLRPGHPVTILLFWSAFLVLVVLGISVSTLFLPAPVFILIVGFMGWAYSADRQRTDKVNRHLHRWQFVDLTRRIPNSVERLNDRKSLFHLRALRRFMQVP